MERSKVQGILIGACAAAMLLICLFVLSQSALAEEQTSSGDVQTQAGQTPMYRVYQHVTGEHLYTQNAGEARGLVNTHGWKYEGIGWTSPDSGTAVYRLYNAGLGNHLYTTNVQEKDELIANYGWTADYDGNPVFYSGGSIPVYRLYNEALHGQHHLTTNSTEYNSLTGNGWSQEGIAFYTEVDGNPGAALPSTGTEPDILLGSFFNERQNSSGEWFFDTTIFGSVDTDSSDGTMLYGLNECSGDGNGNHGQSDPSIIYKDGYFWMLSGNNKHDGKIWPVISYSKDLVNWTSPEDNQLLNGTHGISVDSMPAGRLGWGFDTVAPEWFVDDDGSVYIIVSCGYFAGFHGDNSVNDVMTPYIIKVDQLSASDPRNKCADGVYYWPENLTFQTGTAQRLTSVVNRCGGEADANIIDGSIYKENGTYYLTVKNKGLWNMVFQSTNIMGNNWTFVTDLSFGYEGASLTKFGGEYLLFGDGVLGTKPVGVDYASSGGISYMDNWRAPVFRDVNNNPMTVRHGSVIVLKQGTPEWQIAWNLMTSKGEAV